MQQIIVKKGKVFSEKVPAPMVSDGSVLIKVLFSCVSAGTEMASVQRSEKTLFDKAIEKPEKVFRALGAVKKLGIRKFYSHVKKIGSQGEALGYSLSGIVVAVAEGVEEYKVGDLVAAAGAGKAVHAEFVDVPKNLVMKVPKGLDMIWASTVTLGGIALQGVRRSDLSLGESCVVYGTGILGLLSVQLLKLAGVRVIAIDIDDRRLEIAQATGAEHIINASKEDPVEKVVNLTGGYGADTVLFAANVSHSEPLSQSFRMCRKKGKVVMLGKAELKINRDDVYRKELDLITSTSYGPGRYDKTYEEGGADYPYAYVRWTENRNMSEYLRLLSENLIQVDNLIDKVCQLDDVGEAFDSLKNNDYDKPLIVVLDYGEYDGKKLQSYYLHERKIPLHTSKLKGGDPVNVALVGAGAFAKAMHLPNLKELKEYYNLYAVMSRTGYNAKSIAQEYQADFCTTDYTDIVNDPKVDLVFITSNHASHARLTLEALKAGKNVFVEKPLAINDEELQAIVNFYQEDSPDSKPLLMVGFNRRFSQYIAEVKRHTDTRVNPLFIHYRMNAGYKPAENDIFKEGGRIIGEACHIIDLITYLTGAEIESISYESMEPSTKKYFSNDNKSIVLKYSDGSVGNIHYFAVGSTLLEKEYMEIHFDEKSIILNDYKSFKGFGLELKGIRTSQPDKGLQDELIALHKALTGEKESWPISLSDMVQTTKATFLIK